MRKTILLGLLVFLFVATAGYCITWYMQASQIKRGIENAIAQINAQQKLLSYDAIETSGFPKSVYVSIVRPHFVGRIDSLLKAFPANAAAPAPLPEWNEDLKLEGSIIIGINALSDHYTLEVNGNWQQTATIGAQKFASASQSTGDSVCVLQMGRTGGILANLWDYHALLRDNPTDFLRDLRLLDCNGYPNTVTDATTHEKISATGPWRIYVTSTPQAGQQQVRVYAKLSDIEVTPQGDIVINQLRAAMLPQYSYPIQYSLFGKQNGEVDFSYTGPTDWPAGGKNPPIAIALNKFILSNQLYNTDIILSFSNGMTGDTRKSQLAFKAESNFGEQYGTWLQTLAHGVTQQFYAAHNPKLAPWQSTLDKYTPDQFYAIITQAIPDVHPQGTLKQALDISYEGNAEMTAGTATLKTLDLSSSLYGITGTGSAKTAAGQLIPQGSIALTCSHCPQLIDDATGYAARVQKTMRYFQTPEQAAASTPIDAAYTQALQGFLKALAQPQTGTADASNYSYAIASDGGMGITVNGKNMNDIMGMYNQYMGPVVKGHAPPIQ